MPIIQISLTFPDLNVSAQIGDSVYYSNNIQNYGGQETVTIPNTIKLGEITAITGNTIVVNYDDQLVSPPSSTSFISFAKNKEVNTADLVGYYTKVKFVNDETTKSIELFSVGADVSVSSK